MHFAATKMTAAEIIRKRADSEKSNMGLTSWKGGRVLKWDIGTAKNYLDKKEIDTLNLITVMFLDQAEFRARRRQDIRVRDWEYFLDKFLQNNELPVLESAGRITREEALIWAGEQYEEFSQRRRLEAENEAGNRYIQDLRDVAKELEKPKKKKAKHGKTKRKDDKEL